MKLKTEKQIQNYLSLIGEQNVQASIKALHDGLEVFLFISENKILEEISLTDVEKEKCRKLFLETNGIYAGWVRKKQTPIPGFPTDAYDSHGNYIRNEPYGWSGIH